MLSTPRPCSGCLPMSKVMGKAAAHWAAAHGGAKLCAPRDIPTAKAGAKHLIRMGDDTDKALLALHGCVLSRGWEAWLCLDRLWQHRVVAGNHHLLSYN